MSHAFSYAKLRKAPIRFYIREQAPSFFTGVIFLIFTNFMDSSLPYAIKRCVDVIELHGGMDKLMHTLGLLTLIVIFLAMGRFAWRYFYGKFYIYAAEDLRDRLFKHYTTLGPNFFHRSTIGELVSLISSDVNQIRMTLSGGVLTAMDAAIYLMMIIPFMIKINPSWTWKCLIIMPLIPPIMWKINTMNRVFSRKAQDKTAELAGYAGEIIYGVKVIKGFAQERNKLNSYNEYSHRLEKSQNEVAFAESFYAPIWILSSVAGQTLLIYFGASDVMSGRATIGSFIAFQAYLFKLVWPMAAIGFSLSSIQKGRASFDRIFEVLDTKTDIPDNGKLALSEFKNLKVQNLTFRYPQSEVDTLKNISFEIKAGERVGIVGPVGSGKSTLLAILNRLYPLEQNAKSNAAELKNIVSINDEDIKNYSATSLHSQFVLVPQEPFLFSDTIRNNLNYANVNEPHDDAKLWSTTAAVDIANEVQSLEHGLDSELGEKGVNLSGGQKQRLTIARALLSRRGSVLFLDDVLSAVDTVTEGKIEKELHQNASFSTHVIVAHRLSSVQKVDKIIVLNQGEIEAIGTHRELITKSSTYKKMAEVQGYV